jgi:hypothetical protein
MTSGCRRAACSCSAGVVDKPVTFRVLAGPGPEPLHEDAQRSGDVGGRSSRPVAVRRMDAAPDVPHRVGRAGRGRAMGESLITTAAAGRSNVLLYMIDTLRADHQRSPLFPRHDAVSEQARRRGNRLRGLPRAGHLDQAVGRVDDDVALLVHTRHQHGHGHDPEGGHDAGFAVARRRLRYGQRGRQSVRRPGHRARTRL